MTPSLQLRIYKRCMRLLPLKSGLTRLSFNPVLNRWFKHCSPTVLATYADGTPIEVSINDYHGRVLYLFGTNDPKVSDVSCALLRRGDVFLDIGANYSSIGLAAGRAVGEEGMVHLFEPQGLLCDRVQRAIDLSGVRNVYLHRVGLLDEDGQFVLASPKHHSGKATFAHREETGSWETSELCQVKNIATYVPPLIEGRRFGAKLDIEGAEPRIMPWLLAQPNLRFLVFEAAHHHGRLYEEVQGAGLALYGLSRNPMRFKLARVERFEQMRQFHDLLAVRLPSGLVPPALVFPTVLGRELSRWS